MIYVTTELGLKGADDPVHLARATELEAVLVSQNQRDFDPLHHRWKVEGKTHAGILVTYQIDIGSKIRWLERAARLLTPELARNQLMKLPMFVTEEKGLLFTASFAQ
ncbi:MAG: hypothetical protein HW416_2859 [Chloroflexi bacterium]|nr:hypothetical protein [Chloroflexota bacterium]